MKKYLLYVLLIFSVIYNTISAQTVVKNNGLKGHFDVFVSGGYSGSTIKNLITTLNGDESPNITLSGANVDSKGIYFDGVDDYATFVDILYKSGGTLSWWMKPTKDNTNFDLIGHDFNFSLSNLEYRDLGDKAFIYAETYNNCNNFNSEQFDDFYNSWHMVTIVFKDDLATYYIDGVSVGTVSVYGNMNCSGADLDKLYSDFSFNSIGKTQIGYSAFYKGYLNKILLYNRALNANEIAFNYNSTKIDYGYSGTIYNFTSAQPSDVWNYTDYGRLGPTQTMITNAYRGTSLENKVKVTTRGIQEWTVPYSGVYEITAKGGGFNYYKNTVGGAIMKGKVHLTKGEVLKIAVGQRGSHSGGSGGTFVVAAPYNSVDSPLLVAGGIAGYYEPNRKTSRIPTTGSVAKSASSSRGGRGGKNGGGGGGGATTHNDAGAGGGGFLGNGGRSARNTNANGGSGGDQTDGLSPSGSIGPVDSVGKSFVNGASGGKMYDRNGKEVQGYGGFGGGGGGYGQCYSGCAGFTPNGGGGGYSGGGGGSGYDSYDQPQAGGGGSYFNKKVYDRATSNGSYNGFSDYIENLNAYHNTPDGNVQIKYLGKSPELGLSYGELIWNATAVPFSIKPTSKSQGQLTFESSDTNVLTVDSSGKATIIGAGRCVVKITQEAHGDYESQAIWLPISIKRTSAVIGSSIEFFEESVPELGSIQFTAPEGSLISDVIFANYGVSELVNDEFNFGNCYSYNALGLVENAISNKTSLSINATNSIFGDPCYGTAKRLTVQLRYVSGISDEEKTFGDEEFTKTFVSNSDAPYTVKSSDSKVVQVIESITKDGELTATFRITGGGNAKITISQVQNEKYTASSSSFNVSVAKVPGDLAFENFTKTYGDAEFKPTTVTSSSAAITFTSSNTDVATTSGAKVQIVGVGTTELTANQAESNTYFASTQKAVLTVNKIKTSIRSAKNQKYVMYQAMYPYSNPTGTFQAPTDAVFTNVLFASYGTPYGYQGYYSLSNCHAPDSKAVIEKLALGKNRFSIRPSSELFEGGDPCPDYQYDKFMKVKVQYQYLGELPDHIKTFGSADFTQLIYSNSTEPITVTSSNPDVVSVSNIQSGLNSTITHKINGSGTAVITVNQASSEFYESGTATYTVTINQINSNVRFENSIIKSFEDADFTISAVSSSTGAIQYTSSNESIASVYNNNVIRIKGAGTVNITATQEAAGNYLSGTTTTKLTINKIDANLQPYGYVYAEIPEGSSKTLNTPNGEKITKIVFASYGTPTGENGNYKIGNCHSSVSVSKVEELLLGKSSVNLAASNSIYGDPCGGTPKALYVKAKYLKTSGLTDQTVSYLGSDFTKSDESTSDGKFTISSSNPEVISISSVQNSNSLTITHQIKGAGTSEIKVNQAASSNFNATLKTYTITVDKVTPSIELKDVDKSYGDSNFELSAVSSSTGAITYTSSDSSVLSINGSTASILGAGTAIITATQVEDSNFLSATATATVTVGKTQPIFYEEGFVYGAVNERGALTLKTPNGELIKEVVFASYGNPRGSNGNYVQGSCHSSNSKAKIEAAALGKSSFTIIASNSNFGDPCGGVAKNLRVKVKYYKVISAYTDFTKQVDATDFDRSVQTNSVGIFSVSSSDPSVIAVSNTQDSNTSVITHRVVGGGTAVITINQAASDDYASVSTNYTVTVNKLDSELSLSPINKQFGAEDFELPYTTSSSGALTFSSSNTDVATISGTTIHLINDGTTNITVNQEETPSYNAASVSALLTVSKEIPVLLNFDDLSKTYGDSDITLDAYSDSFGAITYSVADTSIATISGSTLSIVGAGTTEITAYQEEGFQYQSASLTKQLVVQKKALSISGISAEDKVYDGTTSATLVLDTMTVSGTLDGDDFDIDVIGNFSNKSVGTDKDVELIFSLTGADKDQYSVSGQTTTTASITQRDLYVDGVTANEKEYDQTTTATINHSNITYTGLVTNDDVSVEFTGTFEDSELGINKTVSLTVEISGTDKNNYNLSYQTSSTASITPPSAGSYHFTNAGTTGRYGPTQNEVNTAYNGTLLDGSVTINTQGIQEWVVPSTDTYIIEVAGAKGGGDGGGDGAIVKGTINLTQGNVLKIAVGQRGTYGVGYDTTASNGGGGGGGTFVVLNDLPLLIAGGGGGGNGNSGSYPDVDNNKGKGLTLNSGASTSNGGGGINGNGGSYGGTAADGAGGAGFSSNGENNSSYLGNSYGGKSFANGLNGGTTATYGQYNGGHGGFGGGGAGLSNSLIRGGGGGGYSGGQGGRLDWVEKSTIYTYPTSYSDLGYGGGGGSYIHSDFTEVYTSDGFYNESSTSIGSLSKYNDGHGYVNISKLCQTSSLTVSETKTVTYGDASFTLNYSSSSDADVIYGSSDNSVASINSTTGEVTINGAGEVTLTIYQLGSIDYCASNASMILTVNKATPVLSGEIADNPDMFTTVGDSFDANEFLLSTSSGARTYTSLDTSIVAVEGSTISPIATGETYVTMVQEATANYTSKQFTFSFWVAKGIPDLNHLDALTKTYGDPDFEFPYTTDSTGAIGLNSTNTNVATVSGTTISIHASGSTDIEISQDGDENYSGYFTSIELTVGKGLAPISFNDLYELYGAEPFDLSATSLSSGAYTFSSSNENVAMVNGATLTIVGGGTTVLTASQAADSNYSASTTTATLNVLKIDAILSGLSDMNKTYGESSFELSVTSSSDGSINYTSSNPAVATIDGGTVSIVGVGKSIITATQSTTSNYNASSISAQLTVSKNKAQISGFNSLDKTYGDDPFYLQATSSSSGDFTYSSSNDQVATVNGTEVTIVGVGTTILTAFQSSDENYQSNTVTTTLVVGKATTSIQGLDSISKIYGDSIFNLSTTSSSTGSVTYTSSDTSVATISGTSVTVVGVGTAIIKATYAADQYYDTASVTTTLVVEKAETILTADLFIDRFYGDKPFEYNVTSIRTEPMTFSSSNPSIATISGTTITIKEIGETTIVVSQEETDNFKAAIASTVLSVRRATPIISGTDEINKVFGDSAFELSAVSSNNGELSYLSNDPSVATISGTTVIIEGSGSTYITVSQSADNHYNQTDATINLNVSKKKTSLIGLVPMTKTFGDDDFKLTLTSDNDSEIKFESSVESVATISGTTVIIEGAGSTTITAAQSSTSNYTSASVKAVLTVEKANPHLTSLVDRDLVYGDPKEQIYASSLSDATINYTSSNQNVISINDDQMSIVGVGKSIISISQDENENYKSSVVSAVFTVYKAPTEIKGLTNINKVLTDDKFDLNLSSNNPNTLKISVEDSSVATVSGSTIFIKSDGITTIKVTQEASDFYEAASISSKLFVQNQVSNLIGLKNTSVVYGDSIVLTATSNNLNGRIYYSSSNEQIASVNSVTGQLTAHDIGEVTVTAVEKYFNTYITATASTVISVKKRPLTMEKVVVNNKIYDGTRIAFVDESKTQFSGLINEDDIRVNVQSSFDSATVGPYKEVTLVSTLIGSDIAKYELQPLHKSIASIFQKEVKVSGIKVLNKVYDGTLSATVDLSDVQFEGMIEGESLSIKETTAKFENKHAGNQKKAFLSTTYQGADSSNYKMIDQESAYATISKKSINVIGRTLQKGKLYDGFKDILSTETLYDVGSEITEGDLVEFYGRPKYEHADAGVQKTVIGSLRIDGSDASNYNLEWTDGSGLITPRSLNIIVKKHFKFQTDVDPVFEDVLYSGDGFAPSESVENLNGDLVVSRNNNVEEVGVYTAVLEASGLSSANYEISYTKGDFEIVPIDQLMLDIEANGEQAYSSNASYKVTGSYATETNTSKNISLINVAIEYNSKTEMYSFNQDTPSGPISGEFKVEYQPVGASGKVDPRSFTSRGGFINTGVYTLQPTEVVIESDFLNTEVSYKGVVDVQPKKITPKIYNPTKIYDGTSLVPSESVIIEGFEEGDDVRSIYQASFDNTSASVSKTVSVESIQLIGEDAANYTLALTSLSSSDGVINSKPLTVKANHLTKVYDGAIETNYSELYSGFIEGEDESYLNGTLVRSGEAINAKSVGIYDYSLSGLNSSNYQISYVPATLTITKAPLQIRGVQVYDKIYDGTTSAIVDQSLVAYFGLVQGEEVSINKVSANFERSQVGEQIVNLSNYSFTGNNSNYAISNQVTATAVIKKAPLKVKVSSVTSSYLGIPYQDFKVTYEGFVNGEDASVLSGSLEFSGEGTKATKAGVYNVSASGLINDNYEIDYIDGVYLILSSDIDQDGIPDEEDDDIDGDGIPNSSDADINGDGVNDNGIDTDNDGVNNANDSDDDNDGWIDSYELQCGSDPLDAMSIVLDTDQDGLPDCIDTDDDNDGVLDVNDAFPLSSYETVNTDGDGIGNNVDTDDDNDGQLDIHEIACGSDPLNATSLSVDTDSDSIPDCVDADDDNDGILDVNDAFPLRADETIDTDGDGVGNNADLDDDNDGFSDAVEIECGTDPLEYESQPGDFDRDGIADCIDSDIDGDGVENTLDVFPLNPYESVDTDGDGIGNNADADDDNDGVLDGADAFPLDASETADIDADGIGDSTDSDLFNDGFDDSRMEVSGALTPNHLGIESTWKITNINLHPRNRVRVYDKNGVLVFSKENYQNDWRGTFKDDGDLLPSGAYYYKVYLYDTQQTLSGWLYLIY